MTCLTLDLDNTSSSPSIVLSLKVSISTPTLRLVMIDSKVWSLFNFRPTLSSFWKNLIWYDPFSVRAILPYSKVRDKAKCIRCFLSSGEIGTSVFSWSSLSCIMSLTQLMTASKSYSLISISSLLIYVSSPSVVMIIPDSAPAPPINGSISEAFLAFLPPNIPPKKPLPLFAFFDSAFF